MKYEKATAAVVKFDNHVEFMVKSVAGLGICDDVEGPLSQAAIIALAGRTGKWKTI